MVAVVARQEVHVGNGATLGPEVDDKAFLDTPIETLDVVVTQRSMVGKTLPELARLEFSHGVFLRKLTRAGQEIPIAAETRLDGGDVIRLIGTKPAVEQAAKELGYPDRATTVTDMVFVGRCSDGFGRCTQFSVESPRRQSGSLIPLDCVSPLAWSA